MHVYTAHIAWVYPVFKHSSLISVMYALLQAFWNA
jgi:hypothetical protein